MSGVDRNKQFDLAFRFLNETNRSIFLTGKAGTGKTTFLKKAVEDSAKDIVVLAPTGIAALNAGGQTIHSFFRLPFQPLLINDLRFMAPFQQAKVYGFRDKENIYTSLSYTANHTKAIESLETLIIDEISMVRADILDMIDRILRVFRQEARKPFGGVQMVLIGDPYQLPPVVKRADRQILKDIYPEGTDFFNSHIFSKMMAQEQLLSIELQRVYRQNDPQMVAILNRLREGKHNDQDIEAINSRKRPLPASEKKGLVELSALNMEAEQTNQSNLEALPGQLYTYEGNQSGEIRIKDLPCEARLELKEGAQVVFIRNHSGGDYVNGTVGQVLRLSEKSIVVKVEDLEIEVEPYTWENAKYTWNGKRNKITKELRGSFSQYPLKLAWAITVHKSQGLSLAKVLLNIGRSFTYGQVYVALSRCRTWEGMYLKTPLQAKQVKTDPRVIRFMDSFPNQEALMQSYLTANAEYYYHWAWRNLKRGHLQGALAYFRSGNSVLPQSLQNSNLERIFAYFLYRAQSPALNFLLAGKPAANYTEAYVLLKNWEASQKDLLLLAYLNASVEEIEALSETHNMPEAVQNAWSTLQTLARL